MTNTIVIEPASRPALRRPRRGVAWGIASLVFALFTSFWAIIVWAVGLSASQAGSGYGVALVVFALCATVGLAFFVITAVLATFALMRNIQLGVICGCAALAVALGALAIGVLVAVALV
jgi:hypothetical protein